MILKYFNGESLFISKLTMKIGGIWPLDKINRGSLILFLISSACKIVAIIITMTEIYQHVGLKISALMGCVYLFIGFFEHLSMRLNSDRLIRLIESKRNNLSSVKNPEKRQMMNFHEKFGASFFVISIMNFFLLPLILIILYFPFYNDHRLSIDQKNILHDHHTRLSISGAFYWIQFFQNTSVAYGILMLFWSLNMHLTRQFKLLEKKFRRLLQIRKKISSHEKFRRLVDRHNQLLKLSDDLANSFSVFLTMRVLIHQVITCFHAYHVALANLDDDSMVIFNSIEAIAYNSFLLFVLYYSGECLMTYSEKIGDIFKGCKWYKSSKDSKINFAIVILQSQRPKKLTTLGLCKLNLSNYKYMIQSVYSYISIILAIAKRDV